jgi:hypothetical protein
LEIFCRSERDRCDGGIERERESGLLWAGRKRERGRVGLWMAAGRRWRLGEGGDGDEHLKIWDIESWFSKKKFSFLFFIILFYFIIGLTWRGTTSVRRDRSAPCRITPTDP